MDEKGLGTRLQQVRREKGFTQQTLCQKADLSYSTLAKIERGAIKSPSIFTIQRIANVLGVGLDELLGDNTGGATQRAHRRTQSGVEFIYFDINGCLIRGYQRAFTSLAAEAGVLPDIIETVFWRYNDEVNRGTMSVSDLNSALSQRIGAEVDWLSAYLAAVEPIEAMQDILIEAAKLYPVGLFTNSMPGVVAALKAKGTLPKIHYDAIIDSSELGAIKPEPRVYETAIARAGCAADSILLIDDDRANLVGAQQAGWHTLLYDGGLAEDSLGRVRAALEL